MLPLDCCSLASPVTGREGTVQHAAVIAASRSLARLHSTRMHRPDLSRHPAPTPANPTDLSTIQPSAAAHTHHSTTRPPTHRGPCRLYRGAFVCLCVCVCTCACVCLHVCVHACACCVSVTVRVCVRGVRASKRARVCVFVRVCVRASCPCAVRLGSLFYSVHLMHKTT